MPISYVSLSERGAIDRLLNQVAATLMDRGFKVAGTVQTNTDRACTHHCDMDVRVLPDGPVFRISQDLGQHASGCRLDPEALETAVLEVERRLEGAEVLIINKFGKYEAEGRGFRGLIGEALSRGLPVLIGVNTLNMPAFTAFAGNLADSLPACEETLIEWAEQNCRSLSG